MAKYYGEIGYGVNEESKPGVWTPTIKEVNVYGELFKSSRRLETNENLNDNISVSNKISFVADPYALQNYMHIKYATYNGVKWRVTTADVEYPRIVITLGGIYNEYD